MNNFKSNYWIKCKEENNLFLICELSYGNLKHHECVIQIQTKNDTIKGAFKSCKMFGRYLNPDQISENYPKNILKISGKFRIMWKY